MIVQIRIIITIPKDDESRYTIAVEKIVDALNDAVYKEFPHMRDDQTPGSITVVMSKMSPEKEI